LLGRSVVHDSRIKEVSLSFNRHCDLLDEGIIVSGFDTCLHIVVTLSELELMVEALSCSRIDIWQYKWSFVRVSAVLVVAIGVAVVGVASVCVAAVGVASVSVVAVGVASVSVVAVGISTVRRRAGLDKISIEIIDTDIFAHFVGGEVLTVSRMVAYGN